MSLKVTVLTHFPIPSHVHYEAPILWPQAHSWNPSPALVPVFGPGKLEWDDLIEAFDKYEQSNEISEDVKLS